MWIKQPIFLRLSFTITLLFFCLNSHQVQAQLSPCLTCHQEIKEIATEQYYIHRPVQEERCHICHDNNTTEQLPTQQNEISTQIIVETDEKKMEWLAESFVENTHQVALLPADIAGTKLTLKVWYQNRHKEITEFQCPDIETLQPKHSAITPAINQLHFHDYNDLLLSRATLSWTTTTPCQCRLTYRYTGHEYTKTEDDFYALEHTLEIRNFSATSTEVSVLCNDTTGQQISTEFTTLNTLPFSTQVDEQLPPYGSEGFSPQFKQLGDLIELSITTTQPATLAIGRLEQLKKDEPLLEISTIQEIAPIEERNHIELTNKEQLNTKICFKCHSNTVEGTSHPINVLPPPGMIIPPEYPLLENGRMTCMTCHQPHSSNNEARLLKEGKKELCTGCHTNY
ncbi:MAG: hypothetical protein BA874_03150 [Desulfuromonadales bacterium C00003068]|nr:MAG: hypothetical protein BA874_03150 [Desulfuromonadales bacterium C00003068]